MKRSNSGASGNNTNTAVITPSVPSNQALISEFQRGGLRATAGPRLGWTNTNSKPYSYPPDLITQGLVELDHCKLKLKDN
jgi:hypothetical protein